MGQVYQATDTTLNRQVALKILPEAFASDPDRRARARRLPDRDDYITGPSTKPGNSPSRAFAVLPSSSVGEENLSPNHPDTSSQF